MAFEVGKGILVTAPEAGRLGVVLSADVVEGGVVRLLTLAAGFGGLLCLLLVAALAGPLVVALAVAGALLLTVAASELL